MNGCPAQPAEHEHDQGGQAERGTDGRDPRRDARLRSRGDRGHEQGDPDREGTGAGPVDAGVLAAVPGDDPQGEDGPDRHGDQGAEDRAPAEGVGDESADRRPIAWPMPLAAPQAPVTLLRRSGRKVRARVPMTATGTAAQPRACSARLITIGVSEGARVAPIVPRSSTPRARTRVRRRPSRSLTQPVKGHRHGQHQDGGRRDQHALGDRDPEIGRDLAQGHVDDVVADRAEHRRAEQGGQEPCAVRRGRGQWGRRLRGARRGRAAQTPSSSQAQSSSRYSYRRKRHTRCGPGLRQAAHS